MSNFNFLLSLLLVLVSTSHVAEGLWCYECGTGLPGRRSCEDFSIQSSWEMFWRECQGDFLCVKTYPYWNHTREELTVRGCADTVGYSGQPHDVGCWGHASTPTVSCYCNTSLCNTATPTPHPQLSQRYTVGLSLVIFTVIFLMHW